MNVYMDRTFCSQKCGNEFCDRNFTKLHRKKAKDRLISWSDLKTDTCGYIKPKESNDIRKSK